MAPPPPRCRRRPPLRHPHAAASRQGPGGEPSFADIMSNIVNALAAMQAPPEAAGARGADLWASSLTFHPPGAPEPLLRDVSLRLSPNSLGIVFGRSGAGKSTLLQLISGLVEPTAGAVSFSGPLTPGTLGLTAQQRMAEAGIVFQFPERHFVGSTLAEELTAGWPGPDTPAGMAARQALAARAGGVLGAVGLDGLALTTRLAALSDGYKRRVALAVQLVRRPRLLLLDEPLAGLDWRTRGELVRLLAALKDECTVLVVSHDLRELSPLADASWRMAPGGELMDERLPKR